MPDLRPRWLAMVKAVIVLSATLVTLVLTAGCGLDPAASLPAKAEAAPATVPTTVEIPNPPRLERADGQRLDPTLEPSEKDRQAALLLLLLGGRR